jgi:hypothetical protein
MSDDKDREIEELKRQIEELKQTANKELTFKVSPKKAVSIYGLNRLPVTLYKNQLIKLFDHTEKIKEFIKQNETNLI